MKLKIIISSVFLLLLLFSGTNDAQIIHIPDPIFRRVLLRTNCALYANGRESDVDLNNDGIIHFSEVKDIVKLEMGKSGSPNKPILSLEGLSHFLSIKELRLRQINVDTLLISNFRDLEYLSISNSTIDNLEIHDIPQLKTINFHTNVLDKIEFKDITNLRSFISFRDSIKTLDVSSLINLQHLQCTGNKLKILDVSKLRKLEFIDLTSNQLKELDISAQSELRELKCGKNEIKKLDLPKNPKLEKIICEYNMLKVLDVRNCTPLKYLNCGHNKLTELSLNSNKQLTVIKAGANYLTTIDFKNNSLLNEIEIGGNLLKELDISNLTILKNLKASGNKISSIEFLNKTLINWLSLNNNELHSIDLSNLSELTYLYLDHNKIKHLDLSKNLNLGSIHIENNGLVSLNLRGIKPKATLDLEGNLLLEICTNDINNKMLLNSIRKENALNCKLVETCRTKFSNDEIESAEIRNLAVQDSIEIRKMKNRWYKFRKDTLIKHVGNCNFGQIKINSELIKSCPEIYKLSAPEGYSAYRWVKGNSVVSDQKETKFNHWDKKIKLYLSDGKCIALVDSIEYNIVELDVRLKYGDRHICNNTINLSVEANKEIVTVDWFKDEERIVGVNGTSYEATSGGNYKVIITDKEGCKDENEILIYDAFKKSFYSIVSSTNELCKNTETKLTFSSDYYDSLLVHSYKWTDSKDKIISTNENCRIGTPGLYKLELESVHGCFQSDSIYISKCKTILKSKEAVIEKPEIELKSFSFSVDTNVVQKFSHAKDSVMRYLVDFELHKLLKNGQYYDERGNTLTREERKKLLLNQDLLGLRINTIEKRDFEIMNILTFFNSELIKDSNSKETKQIIETAANEFVSHNYNRETSPLNFGMPSMLYGKLKDDVLNISNEIYIGNTKVDNIENYTISLIVDEKNVTPIFIDKPGVNILKKSLNDVDYQPELLVPITDFKLVLNKKVFIKGDTVFGFCTFKTEPYYVSFIHCLPLEIKNEYSFYFKSWIN